MVLPEINSFAKNRENVEELGTGAECDENLSGTRDGSPVDSGMISADDDFVKYETINEESIITYGTDPEEYTDDQGSFRHMLGNETCPWTSTDPPVGSYSSIPSLGPGFEYENCDQFTNGSNANQAGQYSVQSPFDLSVQGQEVPQYYSEAYESRVANHSASQRVSVIVGNMDYPTEETRHLYAPYLQESHFYHPDHHFYYSTRLQPGSYKKKTKRVPKEKKKIVKTSEDLELNSIQKTDLTPDHKNGIHLWQFLLSLLRQPKFEKHIKWVDQNQGIFKIEDSQEVARLWGLRKNRPNMNYDKLSRSIRQYYKKNIIRKPKATSRLVYQFCEKIVT